MLFNRSTAPILRHAPRTQSKKIKKIILSAFVLSALISPIKLQAGLWDSISTWYSQCWQRSKVSTIACTAAVIAMGSWIINKVMCDKQSEKENARLEQSKKLQEEFSCLAPKPKKTFAQKTFKKLKTEKNDVENPQDQKKNKFDYTEINNDPCLIDDMLTELLIYQTNFEKIKQFIQKKELVTEHLEYIDTIEQQIKYKVRKFSKHPNLLQRILAAIGEIRSAIAKYKHPIAGAQKVKQSAQEIPTARGDNSRADLTRSLTTLPAAPSSPTADPNTRTNNRQMSYLSADNADELGSSESDSDEPIHTNATTGPFGSLIQTTDASGFGSDILIPEPPKSPKLANIEVLKDEAHDEKS